MELKSIVAIILFILPGYLVVVLNDHLSSAKSAYPKSDLEKTIEMLLFSIPNVFGTLIIMRLRYDIEGLKSLTKLADDFGFFVTYCLVSVIIAVVISLTWIDYGQKFITVIINEHRSEKSQSHISNKSIWELALNLGENRIAYVYSLDNPGHGVWGVLQGATKPLDANKHILMIGSNTIANEVDKKLLEEEYTFIDISSKTVIKTFKYNRSA